VPDDTDVDNHVLMLVGLPVVCEAVADRVD
jgi:hypothetical protein